MSRDTGRVDRRTVLWGGLASAVAAGVAACSSPRDEARRATPSTTQPDGPNAAGAAAPTTSTSPSGATPPAAVPTILRTPGPDIRHGPRSTPAACLTFHGSGDPALTQQVLRICAEHAARITVFAVGTWLTAHPDLGRAITAGGHDLGNHTWSHQPMLRLDAATTEAEVRDGARAVAAIRGSSPLLFRPSGTQASTARIRAAARAEGYARCISYDLDPLDYLDPGAAQVAGRTLTAVRAGSIVSLHLGHRDTVRALPVVLAGMAERALTAVTVTELLA